jgi:hypothetical protein
VDLGGVFGAEVPVVLSQVQTYADPRPVLTRHRHVLANSVQLRLQPDAASANAGASNHGEEVTL